MIHCQPRYYQASCGIPKWLIGTHFMAWWTNHHVNQQLCSCMKEHVVREWWNNKIEERCYNNHELGCCIKSGFVCSNIREQPLSIRQAVYNMLKHDWTILLFYQSRSIMLTVLWQGCCANNPVIACDIFTRVCLNLVLIFFLLV